MGTKGIIVDVKYSLIVPVKELNQYLDESVPIIQQLAPKNWELIILTDKKQNSKWIHDSRIRILESGRISPGGKRDLGASKSTGEILVFLDDDSYPSSNFLIKVEKSFKTHTDCVAIGGPGVTPPSCGLAERTSGAFFESIFSGADSNRYVPVGSAKYVEDWPSVNFSIQREAFIKLGGFGSKFWPGEDTYLCNKILEAGMRIKYDPEIIVFHHRRESIKAHLIQVRGYGIHRGNFARHLRGNSNRFKFYIPSLFTVLVFSLPISLLVNVTLITTIVLFTLCLYSLSILLVGIQVFKKHGFLTALLFPIYVFSSHLTYGGSFIQGFLKKHQILSKLR
jgi:cellulose synthase/poly-beta-1,6-N-acetylglucosamine synthase-like glycosyltransferase